MINFYKKFFLLVFSCLLSVSLFATNGTMTGAGTDANPFMVVDYADLKVVGTTATYTKASVYRLQNDIDATASKTDNAGAGFLPIGVNTPVASNFTGKLRGGGFKISNLYISRSTTDYVGLFGYTTGTIDSLILENAVIKGRNYVGAIVGYTTATATVNSCKGVNDSVYAATNYVGGIIGYAIGGTISNHSNSGYVNAPTNAGGIIGYATTNPVITACSNTANILTSASNAGGIVGNMVSGSISTCTNSGNVNATVSYAGGIVGITSTNNISFLSCSNSGAITATTSYAGGISGNIAAGSFTSCSNSGVIAASTYAGGILATATAAANVVTFSKCSNQSTVTTTGTTSGGIVGNMANGTLDSCYNISTITGTTNVGGLVGTTSAGAITGSYNTGDVKGTSNIGGLVGNSITNDFNISGSYNQGNIATTTTGVNYAGGIVGYIAKGSVKKSYNKGSVTGVGSVGGIAGFSITNAIVYSDLSNEGAIVASTTNAGGIVGSMAAGSLTSCVNNGTVNVPTIAGGIVGTALTNQISFLKCVNNSAVTITGNTAGGIVGNIANALIDSCSNTGTVSGLTNIGGIAGLMTNGKITSSTNAASISGTSYVGGIAGYGQTNTLTFTADNNQGLITGTTNYVGGILGMLVKGTITSCANSGEVNSPTNAGGILGSTSTTATNIVNFSKNSNTGKITTTGNNAGGIVGYYIAGTIDSCYNQGRVTANNYSGGIVGVTTTVANTYTNCYNDGPVSAITNYAAGIIPSISAGTFTNCYNMDSVTAVSYAGGVVANAITTSISFNSCYNSGLVQTSGDIAGGVVGSLVKGTLESCYNAGDVKAANYVGGIVGKTSAITTNLITYSNSYNQGNVVASTSYAGGIVSSVVAGSFTGCSNRGTVTAPSYVGGVVGNVATTSVPFTDCFNSGLVQTAGSNAGGVVGNIAYGSLSGCYNSGTVISNSNSGGVVGLASTNVINYTDCYNSGTVSSTTDYSGGIISTSTSGVFVRCYNKGTVTGVNYVGGVSGNLLTASVSDSYNAGKIISTGGYIGGLIGYATSSTISQCYSRGLVSGVSNLGGVIGYDAASTIASCFNSGEVAGGSTAGGVIGYATSGTIDNSYNSGEVNGSGRIGGLVGYTTNNTISNCYSTGWVSATSATIGGLIGQAFSNVVTQNCYATGEVKGTTWKGGYVGFNYSSSFPGSYFDKITSGLSSGIGYSNAPDATLITSTTKQMKTDTGTAPFDYTSVWEIRNDSTYPALKLVDNAPFAFSDTIKLSAKNIGNSITAADLLANDFDYETFQANLILKIKTITAGTTDSISSITLPTTMQNSDTIKLSYKVGEVRAALQDTLWGNMTRSIIVFDNHAPSFVLDTVETNEDTTSKFLVDVTDIDGDNVTFSLLDSCKHGNIIYANDSITYIPELNYNGLDSLSFRASDGLVTDTIWKKIKVLPVNDPPSARDTVMQGVADMPVPIKLPIQDIDDSIFTIEILQFPTQGSFALSNDTLEFTAATYATGSDTIRWRAVDKGGLKSDTATLYITIQPQSLSVSPSSVVLSAMQNALDSVVVSSNTQWTAVASESWLTVTSSGIGNGSLLIQADENPSSGSRTATVSVSSSQIGAQIINVTQTGKIQLQADVPTITLSKEFDGTDTASVVVGALLNLESGDESNVVLSATAVYNDATVGSGKTITVKYSISGSAKSKYVAPADFVSYTGEITPKRLLITDPVILASKVYDANTLAGVTVGSLTNVDPSDAGNVTVSASASYDNVSVGNNKTITVTYTIDGSAKSNYLPPVNYTYVLGQITPKQLSISDPQLLAKSYDASTTAYVVAGTLSDVESGDVGQVTVTAVGTYDDVNVGTGKTVTVSYLLSGSAVSNYLAPVDYITNTGEITPKQLLIASPILNKSKVYDAKTAVTVQAGALTNIEVADSGNLSVTAQAQYNDANVGIGKTITVSYTISGSALGNYIVPGNTIITDGEITPKQLLATTPMLALTKGYDATTSCIVSAGNLINVETVDLGSIVVHAIAAYETPNVGLNKTIRVSYYLTGAAVGNYLTPVDYVVSSGEITRKQLYISAPTVVTSKMYDGNATAQITTLGSLIGVENTDEANLGVTALATYNSPTAEMNKTISVVYSLTGSAADNYIAPLVYSVYPANILVSITLSPLTSPAASCEASSVTLSYTVLTGNPTQYKIVYDAAAHAAGFTDGVYENLPSLSSNGSLTITLPTNVQYGIYKAYLQMRNEIGVESEQYPFEIKVNIPSDIIISKFDDVVLVDNSSKQFVAYQWYKNGKMIDGATGQFYQDPYGWVGTYYVKLIAVDGNEFYSCPKVLNIPLRSAKVDISVYPNPLRTNQSCTVDLTSVSKENLLGAVLRVYDFKGVEVYKTSDLEPFTTLSFANVQGVYLIRITMADGSTQTYKLIVKN